MKTYQNICITKITQFIKLEIHRPHLHYNKRGYPDLWYGTKFTFLKAWGNLIQYESLRKKLVAILGQIIWHFPLLKICSTEANKLGLVVRSLYIYSYAIPIGGGGRGKSFSKCVHEIELNLQYLQNSTNSLKIRRIYFKIDEFHKIMKIDIIDYYFYWFFINYLSMRSQNIFSPFL